MLFNDNLVDEAYAEYHRFCINSGIKLRNVNNFKVRNPAATKDMFEYQIAYGKIHLSNILFKYLNKKFNFIKNRYPEKISSLLKLERVVHLKACELYSLLSNSTYKPPLSDEDKALRNNFLHTLRRTKRIIKPRVDTWVQHPALDHSLINVVKMANVNKKLFSSSNEKSNPESTSDTTTLEKENASQYPNSFTKWCIYLLYFSLLLYCGLILYSTITYYSLM